MRSVSPRTVLATVLFTLASLSIVGSSAEAASCKPRKACNAAPTVSILEPGTSATLSGSVRVAGAAGDDTAVAKVEVRVDSGVWQTAAGTTSWAWTWNSTSVLNGTHTLSARSIDTSGKSSTTSRTVSVSNAAADSTAPTVAITGPAAGSTVRGTVAVSGTAADNIGLAKVEVQVDAGPWQVAAGTTAWSWSWNSAAVADGSHVLTTRATDTSGLVASASQTFVVGNATDTTAPNVTIGAPAAGSTLAGTVTVSGTASDNAGPPAVDVRVDAGAWQAASGSSTWSWSWPTTQVVNGAHTLTIRARDTAGNATTVTRAVNVSNTAANVGTCASTGSTPSAGLVLPEGTKIRICTTAGNWTPQSVSEMLRANAAGPGDFAAIAPTLTVEIQDRWASQTAASGSTSGGVYVRSSATIYLNAATGSTFATTPDAVLAHEYGHVWALHHLYLARQGDYSPWLNTRWASANGATTVGQDTWLDQSGTWGRDEIMADDYRLLFGTAAAVGQRPTHLNTAIPDPRQQPGLRQWMLDVWRG